jgi:hypothetical protein
MLPRDPPPKPPVPPEPGDCCGEGCPNCVLDVYDAALERYRRALLEWEARQARRAPGTGRDA